MHDCKSTMYQNTLQCEGVHRGGYGLRATRDMALGVAHIPLYTYPTWTNFVATFYFRILDIM